MRILFTLIISVLAIYSLSAQQPLSASSPSHSAAAADAEVAASYRAGIAIEPGSESPQIRIYPNPASAQIQIVANDKIAGSTMKVYSLLGSEMLSRSIAGTQEVVDVSILQQGLYLYSIIDKNNKTVLTGKFNKQ